MSPSDRQTVRPSIPTVAIIGRPNVGKSTLFNRIIGRRQAIVDAQPGVTRDRHFAPGEWNGRRFWLVDTGGLTDDPRIPMDVEIKRQVLQAIDESDLLMLVVDALWSFPTCGAIPQPDFASLSRAPLTR